MKGIKETPKGESIVQQYIFFLFVHTAIYNHCLSYTITLKQNDKHAAPIEFAFAVDYVIINLNDIE